MTSSAGSRAAFGSNAVWAEKTKLGRSTPDSEAFASSEDEHDLSHSASSNTIRPSAPTGHPRRSSFLSEIKSGEQRKGMVTGSSLQSNTSQPTTPSAEHGSWSAFGPGLTRVASNGSSGAAWAPSIWGSDRRELPVRSNEVSSPMNHASVGSPVGAEPADYFPYNIPLQPILKTQRSQSYSVGQMENELGLQSPGAVGTPSRPRPGVPASYYRPMRPSALGETVYTEGRALGQLNEVEDDDGPDQGVLLSSPRTRQQQLSEAGSNPLLRQATHESARAKHGSASLGASAAEEVRRSVRSPLAYGRPAQSGTESAIDDEYVEQIYAGRPPVHSALLDSTHHRMWTTSLGFGMDEIPQSRRHSLAELPTRRGSLASSSPLNAYNSVASAFANVPQAPEGSYESMQSDYRQTPLDMELNMNETDVHNRTYAHTYFSGAATATRSRVETSGLSLANSMSAPYAQPGAAGGLFGRPGWNVPLYIVTFKCSRAGIFYVHEGTGLDVKEGDLVIVEADRGQDLGTVTHAKLDWSRAKEAMEKAGEDHYKWLMMFSRHNLTLSDSENRGLMASSSANHGSTNRERCADGASLGMQDPAPQETAKPKMIKRLAQSHEIATLREKEGNEAKAKRICQQKANEHNLKMEILDAEFQVDWKKLTFYFYSTEYINFNLLVGDLFKIYKTRIWLSAINPAAFRSKPNQPPSAIGPGAVQGRNSNMNPAASSFHSGGLGSGLAYQEDTTGAIPPPSYQDSGLGSPQHQGSSGSPYGRQSLYGPPGQSAPPEQGSWHMAPGPGSYGQQLESPFGGSPSPAHDAMFRPGGAFGQNSMRGPRNGGRQARPGSFGPPRQQYRD